MPHTRWFRGATLNYAEHVFRQKTPVRPALIYASETREATPVSWDELEAQTASIQAYLRALGVGPGDRVAACLPNIPEATVAMLATLSLGAVWSSCSPDFGTATLLDRFSQISPRVLVMVDGYQYGGKCYDRAELLCGIARALPSVEKVVVVTALHPGKLPEGLPGAVEWREAVVTPSAGLSFTPVEFSHPIWILYSSGTTGVPKAITHCHGGMLLEHLKYLSFHNDVHPGETFFWYTTTGWMMWNFLQASLLAGAVMVLYDGSPGYPDLGVLWRLAARVPISHFGTSAPFLTACMQAGLSPSAAGDLKALRSIGSTGSPLTDQVFRYVYDHVHPAVWLCSMSGGTDVCTAWVGGCPWRPVYAGEIQCRCLGCSMEAFSPEGEPVTGEVGEMVVTRSMPCMPVKLWGDEDFQRYRSSYFGIFPGVWRHGDWIRITPVDGVVILGRSDTTLNRQGVRIGTAEIYRVLERIPSLSDFLVVEVERAAEGGLMVLFVVPKAGGRLTDEVRDDIRRRLRTECSPRHVPDRILEAPELPYTISGKKMEAPVKKILAGVPVPEAANPDAMRNPGSLEFFRSLKL
jgi:acetoacetyl-CoA synthetase